MSRISELVATVDDIRTELVPIPEWNGITIGVRSMDGNRRSAFMTAFSRAREEDDEEAVGRVEADLLVYCCFDPEDNTACFGPEDIPMLMTKNGSVIGKLAQVATRLSGLNPDEEAALVKNSSGSPEQPTTDGTPNSVSNSPSLAS